MKPVLATLAYVRSGGKTLMLRRSSFKSEGGGLWNGLGGKFEPGESPEQCLLREVFEESGLQVLEADLRGFITFPNFDGEADWYVFVYLVTRFAGTVRASSEGELFWVENSRLTSLPLYEGDRHFLPWLDDPRLFSARFEYEEGQYKRHEVAFYDR